jgi:hypothetical protein
MPRVSGSFRRTCSSPDAGQSLRIAIGCCLLFSATFSPRVCATDRVAFVERESSLEMSVDGQPFATYVWNDPKILRPYLATIHAPNGVQVTRNRPPIEGRDTTDHADMHPGLWLAFGDLNGKDFWRNKGTVEHVDFETRPRVDDGKLLFGARNCYSAEGTPLCYEVCRIGVAVDGRTFCIEWESTFTGPNDFYFGDQEEMGLGVRVATPLTVKNGGKITNSDALVNEKQVWGQAAAWCDYSGAVDGLEAGITIVPDKGNFRRSWFHARDYGVLVANPFGQRAFTKGESSKIIVRRGETLRLAFLLVIHDGPVDAARISDRQRGDKTERGN